MTEPDIHLVDEYSPANLDADMLAHIQAHPERIYVPGSALCHVCLQDVDFGDVCGSCSTPMPFPRRVAA